MVDGLMPRSAGGTPMKNFLTIVLTTAAVVSSVGIAAAQQYGEMIAPARNYRGELTCPSNYDIQNGWCVSIYSQRSRYPGLGYGGPGYGGPEPSYGSPEPGYGSPEPGYGSPGPSYGGPEPGYGSPEPGYGSPGPGYGGPRAAGPVARPWVNRYGQLQCPSNYVLDQANNCISIYARRRY